MRAKTIVLILSVLVMVQVFLYDWWLYRGTNHIDEEIGRLDVEYRKLDEKRASLGAMTKKLKANLARIPATVLVEYDDPEKEFTAFLDYLRSPELERVDTIVKMGTQMQKFSSVPIPFYQSDFDLEFAFFNVYDAEKALKYLLVDNKYVLQIRGMKFKRGETAEVRMNASLLVPSKRNLDPKRSVEPTTMLPR